MNYCDRLLVHCIVIIFTTKRFRSSFFIDSALSTTGHKLFSGSARSAQCRSKKLLTCGDGLLVNDSGIYFFVCLRMLFLQMLFEALIDKEPVKLTR